MEDIRTRYLKTGEESFIYRSRIRHFSIKYSKVQFRLRGSYISPSASWFSYMSPILIEFIQWNLEMLGHVAGGKLGNRNKARTNN